MKLTQEVHLKEEEYLRILKTIYKINNIEYACTISYSWLLQELQVQLLE